MGYNIQRFIDAQEHTYEQALSEIKSGEKRGHWIWYIFPQLKGLGRSQNSEYYGIENYEEAVLYLQNEILAERLKDMAFQVYCNFSMGYSVESVFGHLDSLKVRSCMTLFDYVSPKCIFGDVLHFCYSDKKCARTLSMLKGQKEPLMQ